MAISVLSQASALNPGAELWLVPSAVQSRWNVKIDWYLNFQICKAGRHTSKRSADFLNYVVSETGLDKVNLNLKDNDTLLISSQNLLPNRWVAVIDNTDFKSWVNESYKVWHSLNCPTLRVFLPTGQNAGSFNQLWHTLCDFQEFTIVLDY